MRRAHRFGKKVIDLGKRGIYAALRRTGLRRKNLRDLVVNIKISRKITIHNLRKMAKDQRNFDLWERLGFHITPVHFYQPIPDTRKLKDEMWGKKSELVGIDMNTERQLGLLTEIFPNYKAEYRFPLTKTEVPSEFYLKNGAFLSVDAEVLHCMIRYFRPSKIVEVGSGSTTYLAARACRMNKELDGLETKLLAIDPFPNDTVKRGFPGLSTIIPKPLEQVELSVFSQLSENDILFIDSSHVVKIGGDVNYLYLEIIPRLKKGVIVHAHDIFIPAEYPKQWVMEDHFFWTEQYLLQSFLSFNNAFEVLWASSYMHFKSPDVLKSVFPNYEDVYLEYPHVWPSSFWMRRK